MFFSTSIVLIDDKKKELTDLQEALFSEGLPCLPILYQYDVTDNKSGIEHVNIENLKPRIIITDLNLREGADLTAKGLFSPIANMLKKIAVEGPYLLIFWSKNQGFVDEVMSYIVERVPGLQLPIHYSVIDKKAYGVGSSKNLREKLVELTLECKLFNAIINWESRIHLAAKSTTNSLFKLTKPINISGGDYQKMHTTSLQEILASIGNEAVGIKNAAENPGVALDLGLAPVLQDHLSSITLNDSYWKEGVPGVGQDVLLPTRIKPALNSFYHIEDVDEQFPKNCKGVFVELSKAILGDDEKKRKLELKLGRRIIDIMKEEFISDRKLGGMSKPEAKQFRKRVYDGVNLGFIEVSADCDQAQKKVKLNRYLLAVLIPFEFEELTMFASPDGKLRKTAHDGIYKTPPMLISGEKYIIKISYKYQFGTLPSAEIDGQVYDNSWFGNPVLRLRDSILNDISYRCAQHSMRPGIISFY
ncbi:MAG: hypothetical protein ACJAS1_006153 [Oleiphilaceae bacterium]|jgi:hypothetical protein